MRKLPWKCLRRNWIIPHFQFTYMSLPLLAHSVRGMSLAGSNSRKLLFKFNAKWCENGNFYFCQIDNFPHSHTHACMHGRCFRRNWRIFFLVRYKNKRFSFDVFCSHINCIEYQSNLLIINSTKIVSWIFMCVCVPNWHEEKL